MTGINGTIVFIITINWSVDTGVNISVGIRVTGVLCTNITIITVYFIIGTTFIRVTASTVACIN
jgi:hypothetical protein